MVLIVIVMIGFVGAIQVKKWARAEEEAGGDNFTLSDLRRLHKTGKMTTEEFEKARAAIVALAQKAQTKPQPPGKPAPDPLNPDNSLGA